MSLKEYKVIAHHNGMIEWHEKGNSGPNFCQSIKRFRELVIDQPKQVQPEKKVEVSKTAKDTGDYKGVPCKGCVQCKCDSEVKPPEPRIPITSIDMAWERCKQCDSVVCRKKHACKDGQYNVWCREKGNTDPHSLYTLVPLSYDKAIEVVNTWDADGDSEHWDYEARKV